MTLEEINESYNAPLAAISAAVDAVNAALADAASSFSREDGAKRLQTLAHYQTWITQQRGNRTPYDANVMLSAGMAAFLAAPLVAKPCF